MRRVLFVCLGNICRSPMAEALMRAKVAQRADAEAWVLDSAGTSGHHVGEPADPRTRDVLRRHGIDVPLVSRAVADEDFERFDHLLAMDRANLRDLQRRAPAGTESRLALVLEPTTGGEVPDPYYGGARGFDDVHDLLDQALDAWLARWDALTPPQAR